MSSRKLLSALGRLVSGRVLGPAAAARAGYSVNFGGTLRAPARAVVCAHSEEEVRGVLAFCREQRLTLSVRGAGHGSGRQGLSDDGVILVRQGDDTPRRLEGERYELPAFWSWGQVEQALAADGRAVPVLTSEPGPTVGGTLSVGGFGFASLRSGAQVDHVQRLRVVLADGEARWLERNDPLTPFVLGGLGQLALLERVVIRTTPQLPYLYTTLSRHLNAGAALEALVRSAEQKDGPDELVAQIRDGAWITIAAWRAARPGKGPGWLHQREARRPPHSDRARRIHLWHDYVLPAAGVDRFVAELTRQLARVDPGLLELLYLLPVRGAASPRAVLDPRSFGPEQIGFGVGVYLSLSPRAPRVMAEARALQRRCLKLCLAHGGRPYAAGAPAMSQAQKARAYGPALEQLWAHKRALDPERLLNRGAL